MIPFQTFYKVIMRNFVSGWYCSSGMLRSYYFKAKHLPCNVMFNDSLIILTENSQQSSYYTFYGFYNDQDFNEPGSFSSWADKTAKQQSLQFNNSFPTIDSTQDIYYDFYGYDTEEDFLGPGAFSSLTGQPSVGVSLKHEKVTHFLLTGRLLH